MSIMSGLVETGSQTPVAPPHSAIGEWMVRHAWSIVLLGSLAVWGLVTALIFA